jgi:hypothetical protein
MESSTGAVGIAGSCFISNALSFIFSFAIFLLLMKQSFESAAAAQGGRSNAEEPALRVQKEGC